MKDLNEVTNEELLQLYRLIVEHQEYLKVEMEKVGEEKKKEEEEK